MYVYYMNDKLYRTPTSDLTRNNKSAHSFNYYFETLLGEYRNILFLRFVCKLIFNEGERAEASNILL